MQSNSSCVCICCGEALKHNGAADGCRMVQPQRPAPKLGATAGWLAAAMLAVPFRPL